MKYAVEIARAGSLSKAAETLLIAQPNLSRAVKDLEADLGITIFDRTAKGMFLTSDGREFIHRAKKILAQIDDMENLYKAGVTSKRKFSISVPRASYIAEAFVNFSETIGDEPIEIYYEETNSLKAVKNIISSGYKMGIVRYATNYDKYFKVMLEERDLAYELVAEFYYLLVMRADHPLASKKEITREDLNSYIEIAHPDLFVPTVSLAELKKEEFSADINRRIFVFDRASQFDLLSKNKDTFMWVSPVSENLLSHYGLVQRECTDDKRVYNDVLIYRNDYRLTPLDKLFIDELNKSKQHYL